MGDRQRHLRQAVRLLGQIPQISQLRLSPWFANPPLGGPAAGGQAEQADFLNGAALLQTSLSPYGLFRHIEQIESWMGRQRTQWWGPRTIDCDILLYNDVVIDEPRLTIPHPWMTIRPFVMRPAVQIAADMVHPLLGWSLQAIWDHLIMTRPYIAIWNQSDQRNLDWLPELAVQFDARLVSSGSTVDPDTVGDPDTMGDPDTAGDHDPSAEIESLTRALVGVQQENPGGLCISDFWLGEASPPSLIPSVLVILRRAKSQIGRPAGTVASLGHKPIRRSPKDRLAPRLPHLIIDIGDLNRARQKMTAVIESVVEFQKFAHCRSPPNSTKAP